MLNLPSLVFYIFFSYGSVMEMLGCMRSVFLLTCGHRGQIACCHIAAVPYISILSFPWRICDTGGRLWPSFCSIPYLCGGTCTSFAVLFPMQLSGVSVPKILSDIPNAILGVLGLFLRLQYRCIIHKQGRFKKDHLKFLPESYILLT